ncbi:translation elongation factor 2 (EF-2/EF-G) [Limimonas halophila]|uniref:Elongation factor G n=1 Tax=Limimonas halophila TaxID=1082479 RepID=A0A1G7TFE0_9PROT|nr:elongation factor G [Limimonas halophila]SDG34023.1 translation elongation factor 2 (EF-2/EF-G) [Limimonas halophila]
MTHDAAATPRCAVLAGQYTSGKTTLLEALLHSAGALDRRGSPSAGTSVGDASREAREREMSVEPNVAEASYLGDPWSIIDCPGSIEFMHDTRTCLMAADVAVVVAEPDPERVLALDPLMRTLDAYAIPHMVFINQMDRAETPVREVMAALQDVSARPLVLRQVPIREGGKVSGYVDLVSERAYRYRDGQPSELVSLPEDVAEREEEARQALLESLADYDDELLEKLLEDAVPPAEEIYADLKQDVRDDLVVPVFLGSAAHGHGITRLWKALRHETPGPAAGAERLGVREAAGLGDGELAATVVRTFHQPHAGKLSLTRVWQGQLTDGDTVAGQRLSAIYRLTGSEPRKVGAAGAGELVALPRLDALHTGSLITGKATLSDTALPWPSPAEPVYTLVVEPEKRADEVKLTTGISRLVEEDAAYRLEHDPDTGRMLLQGQGEMHLAVALDKLRHRFNVEVRTERPPTPYRETIRQGTTHHSRFKRQTGGHGQFADVQIKIAPRARGEGFQFTNAIVGGTVPKQFVPAVEEGVREALERGPLGFPVVDVAVELFDGQYHSVDSSEQAFKTVGRMAVSEALPSCDPVLLEPIERVTVSVPKHYTHNMHGLVAERRGQVLGFDDKPGWTGWDDLEALMPAAALDDFIIDLRSLTRGLGFFTHRFERLQELTGREAERVLHRMPAS